MRIFNMIDTAMLQDRPAPPSPKSTLGFAQFYAATLIAIAACGLWNASRLHARAELLSDAARTWAQSAIETFAPTWLMSRERALGAVLSQSYQPQDATITLARINVTDNAGQHLRSEASPQQHEQNSVSAPTINPMDTVVFAGDSLANGYAAGAARALGEIKSKTKALDEGKISTGLVSQSYFDWPARAKIICASKPGAIVFSFGSNDPIDMKIGGVYARFGSSTWTDAYEARAAAMVETAHQCGARAVWLMLPPMREASMQKKAQAIAEAQQKACKLADACIQPFRGLGDGLDQTFKERAMISGKSKLLRAEDGIHMAPEGYYAVAKQALEGLGIHAAKPMESPLKAQSESPSSGT